MQIDCFFIAIYINLIERMSLFICYGRLGKIGLQTRKMKKFSIVF